jgi:hypothetical protein
MYVLCIQYIYVILRKHLLHTKAMLEVHAQTIISKIEFLQLCIRSNYRVDELWRELLQSHPSLFEHDAPCVVLIVIYL